MILLLCLIWMDGSTLEYSMMENRMCAVDLLRLCGKQQVSSEISQLMLLSLVLTMSTNLISSIKLGHHQKLVLMLIKELFNKVIVKFLANIEWLIQNIVQFLFMLIWMSIVRHLLLTILEQKDVDLIKEIYEI